ncbi:hypothetical protein POTOM_059727 [Populus tomentosa]|uniref:Uncharacterized protein n=1 Tax=Populus tomentosa TaxID=118781 RepID=A0A8X7XUM5_POPTO|nr:hypothetical protein POTOM_059727 [Populus tomentosa]
MPMSKPNPKPASMPDKKRERHINDQFSGKPELETVRRVDGLAKVAASASGLLKKIKCENTPCVGMLSMPKKHSEMRTIGGPKGVLKVLEVEPTGMCSRVAQPSGLLNDLNQEIMNRMRSRKQLFSARSSLLCVKTEYEEEIDDLGISVRRADDEDDKDDVMLFLSPNHNIRKCKQFCS